MSNQPKKIARWYFGGMSSTIAVGATHPLDLLKVHMQTQEGAKVGIVDVACKIVRTSGLLSLYNGISAGVVRQIMYSFPRFGIYEFYKNKINETRQMALYEQFAAAGFSGMVGGLISCPADIVNVRMQNDIKLPENQRRNYKHVFDGMIRIFKAEGLSGLYVGSPMAVSRAVLMNIGQASGYDKFKGFLMQTGYFSDNPVTHFISACGAAMSAIALSNPLDVVKTRLMNSQPGTYTGVVHCAKSVAANGLLNFYSGLIPAFIRIGPHTIIMYLIKEQLIRFFGTSPS